MRSLWEYNNKAVLSAGRTERNNMTIKENQYNPDGLLQLGNAIILQAVDDYEKAIAVLSTDFEPSTVEEEEKMISQIHNAERMRSDCERFFNGKWFKLLTAIEPESILGKVRDGILNAPMVVYDEKHRKYPCDCGNRLAVRYAKGCPIIKCVVCKKYWRIWGKPISIE